MSHTESTDKLTKSDNDALVRGQIRYLDTATAYDLWSAVYDTDGNFLQAVDDLEMPELLDSVLEASPRDSVKIVDLGCGTGRNTLQAMNHLHGCTGNLLAVDLSPKMLDVAKSRCAEALKTSPLPGIEIEHDVYDMINASQPPTTENTVDVVISTLVLEHIPLGIFMKTASALLKSGGYFILTNMHSDMGAISQAGFIDPVTQDKIRPTSYAHTVAETISSATAAGLTCVSIFQDGRWILDRNGHLKEVAMTSELASQIGPRAKKWIGINVWFGGVFRKA